jgi:ribonucleoside-diphosphate reductase alpha chain
MGFADLLVDLGIPYDAPAALELGGRIAAILEEESLEASAALAAERGPFPGYAASRWAAPDSPFRRPLRNATTTTVAPTGTISIIAGCSGGIEPLFAVAFERHVLDGAVLREIHPAFVARARAAGIWSEELERAVVAAGRVRGLSGVPDEVQAIFPTAHDIPVETHIRMQAAFQRHVHAAVSKTINLPHDATVADVEAAYRLAWELGCKGITVYRDRSRDAQVLSVPIAPAPAPEPPVFIDGEGGDLVPAPLTVGAGSQGTRASAIRRCPDCQGELQRYEACTICRNCGWSVCG